MAYIYANPSYTDPLTPYADGGGAFNVGDTATLEAHTTPGYFFSHWTDGAGRLYFDNPLNVKVHDDDETYTAHFTIEENPDPEDEGDDPSGEKPEYTVTVTCEHPGEGIVTGGGVYKQGEVCTITATELPNAPNHKFVGWQNPDWDNQNGAVLKKRVHSFEVFDDETWVAIFDDMGPEGYPDWTDDDEDDYEKKKKREKRTINVIVQPVPAYEGDNSTATGGGTFYAGELCTLTATPDTSENPDNHFIMWKRTASNSQYDTTLETRTENPYSFHVYAPDQYWWAIFGTGLTRVTVSSNLPISGDGRQGGAVWIYGFDYGWYTYVADKLYCPYPYTAQVRAGTFLRHEVIENLSLRYEEWFMSPQQNGDLGIWMPEYIIERKSKKKIMYPCGDVQSWWYYDVYKYSGRIYVAMSDLYLGNLLEKCGPVVDLYVHFVQIGHILRNSGGNILRNATRILRANG